MNPIFSRTLKVLCAVTAAVMLSACGGASSTVDPFVATRVIAFGDGFNYVDGAGAGLSTVQTGETDNTIAGRIAARYGIVVKNVQTNALAATGGFSYATEDAKVSNVVAQINDFLTTANGTVAKKDLIIIAVGNWDIKANAEGTATETIDAATTNLVTAIQRLTAAGAEHVVVMPAINMARTPWAATSPNSKSLADIQQLSITTSSLPGLNSFNFLLLTKLNAAFRQDRKPVYLLDRSSDFNNFAGKFDTNGTTRIINVSGLALTADTGLYVPVCTAPTAMAGCALGGLNTTSPLTATSYQSYVFADDMNLTPLANRFLADRMIYTMQTFGWAP
jgi:phospholipase/lecithinase/hemolysin